MGEWEYGNMGEYLERVALITVMVGGDGVWGCDVMVRV